MSQSQHTPKVYSLLQITESLQRAVKKWYATEFWIKAEMNKLNYYTHSGHCYPDLVERKNGKVVAQIRANLWADNYKRINQRFLSVLREPLKDGVNILFLARVSFHPVYGLSLIISDMDPNFTLGDLEREKQETITRLKVEGLFTKNKSLKLPLLPKRIAIISVETSKGFADFKSVLDGNNWAYGFFYMLFPALLQGDNAVDSILNQLHRIESVKRHFDLVLIIRGGGGDVGLACYNNFEMAKKIANFPLPVLTGIGHSTNETVAEMIAWKNAITPTELADFLLQMFHNFSVPVQNAHNSLLNFVRNFYQSEKQQLTELSRYFKSLASGMLKHQQADFKNELLGFKHAVANRVSDEKSDLMFLGKSLQKYPLSLLRQNQNALFQTLRMIEKNAAAMQKLKSQDLANAAAKIRLVHPDNILKRGYSITRFEGKAVLDFEALNPGDQIETTLFNGQVKSTIIEKSKNKE